MILNSLEAALELMDKRSAITSDRPRLPMLMELMGSDILSFHRYGNKWRIGRRIFHQSFNVRVSTEYHPQQAKAVHELLYRLAHTPEDFMDHIRLMAGSLILNITYGFDIQSIDNPCIVTAEKSARAVSEAGNPGAFLVDTLPFLKYVPEWVPGAGFKRKAMEWRRSMEAAIEVSYQHVMAAMEEGVHKRSIMTQAMERFKGNKEAENNINSVTATAFLGGADTTTTSLHTFILAMVLYPDVVRKAQEELDIVVGQDRLPDFSDKDSLPYVCAIVKEVLRWYPLTPLGFGHRLMTDDVYERRFLPAGSLILGNAWVMLRDESAYKNPGTFNPEPFLKDSKLDPDVRSPEVVIFGFGRRRCPGRYLLLSTLFLNIACILATFDIGKAIDENGTSIPPSENFTTGLFCHPLPFKCSIKPRSRQASDLIAKAYAVHKSDS